MNAVILMLAVTACYTICSLNDKYAAAKSEPISRFGLAIFSSTQHG